MKVALVIKSKTPLGHLLVMDKIEIWRENGAYQEVVSDNG
jgi:hypothetical protein